MFENCSTHFYLIILFMQVLIRIQSLLFASNKKGPDLADGTVLQQQNIMLSIYDRHWPRL